MSMADDDDVGRDLSQLLVLANIFPRDALPPDGRWGSTYGGRRC